MTNPASLFVCLMLLAAPGPAQAQKRELLQVLTAGVSSESRVPADQREGLLAAVQVRFADRAHDAVESAKQPAARAALEVLAAGAAQGAAAERVADASLAAYTAVTRGAPADIAQGIALYGLAKGVSAESVLNLATGHLQMTDIKVQPEVAAEAARNALDNSWDAKTFDTVKWGLVHAAKTGFDQRAYASFVFARLLEDRSRPGAVLADASAVFMTARKTGKTPEVPPYQGVFEPFVKPVEAKPEEKPAPKAVEAAPAPKPEEKPKAAEAAPAPKPEEKPKAAEAAPAPKPEEKPQAVEPEPAAKEPPSLKGGSSPLPEGAKPAEPAPKAAEPAPKATEPSAKPQSAFD